MYTTSYNQELKTAQAEVIRLFSNITIPVVKDGRSIREIVPCVFGQTSRILKSIMNPQGAAQIYPIISVERGNIQIDLQRNSELQHDISIMTNPRRYDPNTKPPTPINLGFTVNAFSKYPEELDMIVTNFIPFFNKDVFVITPHPKLEGRKLRHQLVWGGDVTFDWKGVLQNTDQDIQVATFKFDYKTEIFGGVDKLADNGAADGDIYTINMALTPSDGEIYPEFDSENPENNLFSGFFAVPYTESFAEFSARIIDRYLAGEADHDGLISNVFNARFNTGVMNHDIAYMEDAVANGANIFKYSYWPYKYAEDHKYEDVMEWLSDHGALVPKGEHYVSKEVADYTLSEYGKRLLAAVGVFPEGGDGEYTHEQIDENRAVLSTPACYEYARKIEFADLTDK